MNKLDSQTTKGVKLRKALPRLQTTGFRAQDPQAKSLHTKNTFKPFNGWTIYGMCFVPTMFQAPKQSRDKLHAGWIGTMCERRKPKLLQGNKPGTGQPNMNWNETWNEVIRTLETKLKDLRKSKEQRWNTSTLIYIPIHMTKNAEKGSDPNSVLTKPWTDLSEAQAILLQCIGCGCRVWCSPATVLS